MKNNLRLATLVAINLCSAACGPTISQQLDRDREEAAEARGRTRAELEREVAEYREILTAVARGETSNLTPAQIASARRLLGRVEATAPRPAAPTPVAQPRPAPAPQPTPAPQIFAGMGGQGQGGFAPAGYGYQAGPTEAMPIVPGGVVGRAMYAGVNPYQGEYVGVQSYTIAAGTMELAAVVYIDDEPACPTNNGGAHFPGVVMVRGQAVSQACVIRPAVMGHGQVRPYRFLLRSVGDHNVTVVHCSYTSQMGVCQFVRETHGTISTNEQQRVRVLDDAGLH